MVLNFALEKGIRYVKLALLILIAVHLYQIARIVTELIAEYNKPKPKKVDKFATIYDITRRGYNKNIPVHPVLYKLLIQRSYFKKQWLRRGRFEFSQVLCNMNVTVVGEFSTHTMCQVPFYPQLQRNTRNVFFIGGAREDKMFRYNFHLLTASYYNVTFVNNTELDVIVKEQMGIKDLVSGGYKFGTTEMLKYDLHRPGQEQLVHSLTTPVEACMIFVALRAHPPERVRQFVWEMNFSLYHLVHDARYTPSGTFLTFMRHSCLAKHNAQGPNLALDQHQTVKRRRMRRRKKNRKSRRRIKKNGKRKEEKRG